MKSDRTRNASVQDLAFYASHPHACSYLAGREAVLLFADPTAQMDNAGYSRLADYGFRRSGANVYRPSCPQCTACIPVRLPVNDFAPRRTQARAGRRNRDLIVHAVAPEYRDEHFRLYRRYIRARHPGGGMDSPDPTHYLEFLRADWSNTTFYEFRLRERLVCVAVVDRLDHGLSAVYTFFDPDLAGRSLGTYAILWEIEETRRRNLPWLYLGYWIRECDNMRYKGAFRPLEVFRQGHWIRMDQDR